MMARVEGGNRTLEEGKGWGYDSAQEAHARHLFSKKISTNNLHKEEVPPGEQTVDETIPPNQTAFQKTMNDRNQQKVESCMNKFSVF